MTSTGLNSHTGVSPLSSLENSHHHHHAPVRLTLSRCTLSAESGVPLFIEKCIQFIEEYGLSIEGLYRISGYKNQVELVINKLIEGKTTRRTKASASFTSLIPIVADPTADLHLLHVPASAVATALKDMMRKLDEPLLSTEVFDQCDSLTSKNLVFLIRKQDRSPCLSFPPLQLISYVSKSFFHFKKRSVAQVNSNIEQSNSSSNIFICKCRCTTADRRVFHSFSVQRFPACCFDTHGFIELSRLVVAKPLSTAISRSAHSRANMSEGETIDSSHH